MNKVRFLLVGALVFVCDGAVFYCLGLLGLKVELARAVALTIAVQLTFVGHRVFALNVTSKLGWCSAWLRHQVACGVGAIINYCLFSALFYFSHNQIFAFFIAILCTTLVNFMLATQWVYRTPASRIHHDVKQT